MSYLNNSTIVVDSILTKRGRELMAQGVLKITKFALSDDEVNYGLYNIAHPSGSSYYDDAITNLPVLEAFPDGTKLMKYKLITLPKGTSSIPVISVSSTSISLKNGTRAKITPSTLNNLNSILGYTATLSNTTYVNLVVDEPVSGTETKDGLQGIAELVNSDSVVRKTTGSQLSKSVVGKSFTVIGKQLPASTTSTTATLTISGNETGGQETITITITNTTAIV